MCWWKRLRQSPSSQLRRALPSHATLTHPTNDGGSGLNPPLTHDGVMLNDATVVATDVEASNGAIHVIDTVIVTSKVDVDAVLD